jgi:hypothetical protein
MSVEVASFDLRFTPHGFDQDRYLFYLVPLFAVGAAAALVARDAVRPIAALALAVSAAVTWLVWKFGNYHDADVIFWAAPGAAAHTVFPNDVALLSTATGLVVVALVLMWCAPRAALASIVVLGAVEALYVFERYEDPTMTRPPALAPARDWIDRRVPPSASVAIVPSPRATPAYWWEAELRNRRVDRVLRVDDGPT